MTITKRQTTTPLLFAALAGLLLSLPQVGSAARSSGASAQQDSNPAAREIESKLNKSYFKNVKASVDPNGIATLTGTVDLYEYKIDADKRVHKAKGVSGVRNMIEVAGPSVSDKELQDKLGEKLAYDRVGYGNAFNAIGLKVENGVVTLGGHARTPWDKDSAIGLVSTYPGVKDVVDEVEVDPVSMMDDQTRLQVARAIYGYAALQRYSMDPAKPIRISVQNGNVELYGTVDSEADKNLANIRANGVPNVFSVKNYLQVANKTTEAQKQ
jgi:osmotically-inducible protein OsmY